MNKLNLFVVLLGGRASDDKIEAHNLFIGVAETIESLLSKIIESWPAVTHIDAYMILKHVNGYDIAIQEGKIPTDQFPKLIVVNIGYYKTGEFAEFHKLIPLVLTEDGRIIDALKLDPDFSKGQSLDMKARSHQDDKHEIDNFDVDDEIDVQKSIEGYFIQLIPSQIGIANRLEIGYQFGTEIKKLKEKM